MLERYRTKAGAPVRVDVGRKVVTIRGCRDQAALERQLERRYGPGVLEDAGQLMRWRRGEAQAPAADAKPAAAIEDKPGTGDLHGVDGGELPVTGHGLEADVDDAGRGD